MNTSAAELTAIWTEEIILRNPLLLDKISDNPSVPDGVNSSRLLLEAIRFIYLCSESERTLTPSRLVDEAWHQFILFTRSYAEFCAQKLGRFVHHQPSNEPDNERLQYEETLQLYQRLYGRIEEEYWPRPSDTIAACGLCENG